MDTLQEKLKTYVVECALVLLACLATTGAGYMFVNAESQTGSTIIQSPSQSIVDVSPSPSRRKKIVVEISGSVLSPDIYEVTEGARLKDIITLAGGMSNLADKAFVARNFNLAQYVTDQEKIHIPSIAEIKNGIFVEESHTLEYLSTDTTVHPTTESAHAGGISINSATAEELDLLPGIGPTTAQKIVQARPFSSVDELLSKKLLKQTVFDQIANQIQL